MHEQPLIVSRDGAVAFIQLTQPKTLNAITLSSAAALLEVLQRLASDDTLRAVVLSGAGRAFMAGGDLTYLESSNPKTRAENAKALIECLHTIIELMISFPTPILSQVHGVVAGAGLGVMLASDLTIAAEETRFAFAYSDLGTSPDGGLTWFLARMIGVRRALQFATLRTQLNTEEALSMGLVQEVLNLHALPERGKGLAVQLSQLPRKAFQRTRRLLLESGERTLHAQLDAERDAFILCAESDDFAEGIQAFRQRRRPRFT
jgi:2-(1,2-epoxy-1,2-dihydrophenyl)acetyl-CoA isomerase